MQVISQACTFHHLYPPHLVFFMVTGHLLPLPAWGSLDFSLITQEMSFSIKQHGLGATSGSRSP